jgi:hypothetical protein
MDVYVKLLNVSDPSKEPEGSLSKRLNIDPKVFGGLVSQMKTNPAIRADLNKMGYIDEQIPEWVAAVDNPVGVDAGVGGVDNGVEGVGGADGAQLQKPKPAGAPIV